MRFSHSPEFIVRDRSNDDDDDDDEVKHGASSRGRSVGYDRMHFNYSSFPQRYWIGLRDVQTTRVWSGTNMGIILTGMSRRPSIPLPFPFLDTGTLDVGRGFVTHAPKSEALEPYRNLPRLRPRERDNLARMTPRDTAFPVRESGRAVDDEYRRNSRHGRPPE